MEAPDIKRNATTTDETALLQKVDSKSQLPPSPQSAPSLSTSKRYSIARQKSADRHQAARTGKEEEEDPFKDADEGGHHASHGNWRIVTVLQWIAFIVLLLGLICSRVLEELKHKERWGLELWKFILMAIALFCGRLVSGWVIRILVLVLERSFLVRKKLLYFVYGLRKGVQNCLWLGLALLAWKLMIEPAVVRSTENHRVFTVVTELLVCFVVGAFIWLGKILVVKSLASSFHVSAFFDRIQESVFDQHVLETLLGPALRALYGSGSGPGPSPAHDEENPSSLSCFAAAAAAAPAPKPSSAASPARPSSSLDIHTLSRKDVSAGMMTKLMNVVNHPGFQALLTTIDEEVDHVVVQTDAQAKAMAKNIFRNVAEHPDSGFISREDLRRFLDEDRIDKVIALFEGGKDTGKISKKALKNWVVKAYQDKRSLVQSLNDTKSAVKELHHIASVLVSIVIIIVWLVMLGIATTQILVFAGSQLLLVGFMFGNTVKQVFEAIIFLFVMHPYDVGDRCMVDGVQLIVSEMKILTTVFLKPDNEKVYYPNSVLATKPISNLYRSPEMKDILDFDVHISTSTEQINALKQKITGYVEKKSEHWNPKFTVIVKELEEMNRLMLTVTMQHTINFHNMAERLSRRSELLLEMKKFFSDLGIEFRLLTRPVQILSPYPSTLTTTSQFVNTGYPYPPPSAEYADARARGL